MKRLALVMALVALVGCKKAEQQPAQGQMADTSQLMGDTAKMMADTAKMMGDTAKMMKQP